MFKRKSKSDKPAKKSKPKAEKKKRPPKVKAPAGALKKQPTDIYTVMLIISLVAVLIACILLFLEVSDYGDYPWWEVG